MSIQYTPILEHKTRFPMNTAYKAFVATGDDFYNTVNEALADAAYQMQGENGKVQPVCILSVDTETGETKTVVTRRDIGDAIRDYEHSQMSNEDLADERACTIADARIDERQEA